MKMFAAKVEEGREGRDGQPSVGPVYRNLVARHDFPPTDPNLSTAWEIFRASVEKYPRNRMLGWREFLNHQWGPYVWKTYEEVYQETICAGSALRACGIQPGARVGIYGSNCPQWIVAMELFHSMNTICRIPEQACSSRSLICVPLYDTLGPGAVDFIIDHAEIDFVFIQDKKVKELLSSDCKHARQLKLIICFTSLTEEEKNRAASIGVKSYSWNDFLHMAFKEGLNHTFELPSYFVRLSPIGQGKENPSELLPPQPFNICTIMYTSGTSGSPKGVILTHENISTCIRGVDIFMEQFEDKMTVNDVYISFLPLAHILDRMIEEYFFHKGAAVGYFHGEISELQDDLMELKPTFLAGVPRVFERVREGVLKALEELNPVRRKIFGMLYNYKLKWMKLGCKQKDASPIADLLAFRKVKARLGGRVRLIISGGAPLSSEVEEFLRVTSCAFVLQGYGLTETSGLAAVGFPDEMCLIGTVGPAFVYNEVRLEEVPEMGYYPLGDRPRGDICVRGKMVFAGYYKNPELTRETIKDGWFHTGDIGEMSENGVIRIIDRKKNLIKLSHGEYVAVEYLEKVYCVSPTIEDIWVYGDSFKSMLIAVVVPNEENTVKWARKIGYQDSFSGLCSLNQLQDYILQELKSTAQRNKLRGFEHIKGIILEPQPFELQKDLVTPTLKKKRDQFLKHYKGGIEDLYKKLAAVKR